MTTETARRPRGVTDLAIHRRIVVRECAATVVAVDVRTCARLSDRSYRTTPSFSIALQRFRVSGFGIVVRRERINRVDRLWNFPANIGRHRRLLPELISFPNKPRAEWRVAGIQQIDLASVAACNECWSLVDSPVAINTCDRGGIARLAVVDRVVVEIEQVAFAVVFEHSAKHPAVPVIIGELSVFESRI